MYGGKFLARFKKERVLSPELDSPSYVRIF